MPTISPEEMIQRANGANIRLSVIRGMPVWEPSPAVEHGLEVDRIRSGIKTVGQCIHAANVLFRFADGSWTEPDIAVLRHTPEPAEGQQALTIIPEAVVEIISEGYEQKDLELAPPFYLSMGVKDVLIYDPQLKETYHHRRDGKKRVASPALFSLECGCACEI